jgi:hypothetical protein
MRLAALFYLACMVGFAGSWEGVLVTSNCYEALERNVNPFEPRPELRGPYCRANARTKGDATAPRSFERSRGKCATI